LLLVDGALWRIGATAVAQTGGRLADAVCVIRCLWMSA
jgi:hypothetical protein